MLTEIGARLRRLRRRFSRAEFEVDRLRLERSQVPTHSPGLLLIQIDGLSRIEFDRAIVSGRLPYLSRLLRREGCRLHTFYSGQPATTPAVQGELFYGVKAAVPAFNFFDRAAKAIGVMYNPDSAKRVEAQLAEKNEGLLKDGSSWSNIYTGGATQEQSHFCGASMGFSDLWKTGKIRNIFLFGILHFPSFLRLLALLPVEFVIACVDAVRGLRKGENLYREFLLVIARVFICVGLREMVTLGAKIDVTRGLPIIHANFLGYDEQSHRRGPSSRFAHWTLLGIDRAIRHLHAAARRAEGRDYEIWVFSDHGQIGCKPFSTRVPDGLPGLVERCWPEVARVKDLRVWLSAPPGQRRKPIWRHASYGANRGLSVFEGKDCLVTCFGPVGHIYFKEQLDATLKRQLADCLIRNGVPGVLFNENGVVRWLTKDAEVVLPEDTSLLRGPAELLPTLATDLAGLATHPNAGELVCLGWCCDGTSYSFAEENGAHCGPSPQETQGFLLVPPASSHLFSHELARPTDLRNAALTHIGRATRPKHRRSRQNVTTSLRVVTYNVHYCRGLDGRFAPDRVKRILRDLDPDIIALQELDCGRPRSRGDDQLAEFAADLGLHQLFAPSIVNGEEKYGHGLLSTRPLTLVRQSRLPTGGVRVIEPRDGLHARLLIGDREVDVLSTHLGLAYRERAAQIDALLGPEFLGSVPHDRPTILMGDLNLTPSGRLYKRLTARWRSPSGGAILRHVQGMAPYPTQIRTFPSFFPVRQLDHIFVTSHFRVLAVHSPANLLTRRASDHLPLVADLEIANG
ncbi:MAG: endonuclease/exonuclease/phosphatase family protein [Opitutaceae bacterium]|nr:endonuclease/exonuclease/phosphatase family protein [Opitutaceae bacterium]